MANPDFNLCDVCGKRVPNNCRLSVATGREMSGAGSTETTFETVDLCHEHMVDFLRVATARKSGSPESRAAAGALAESLVAYVAGAKRKVEKEKAT